ncbi:hypothetical protein VPNG_03873 [Cytospora leucostoma]|uniref:Uncharacterized protein n=1 Tax=Cytospora leucostoma TaxID=1230097 RepID=A0A423XE35_9PEZI|nr:hypothetical protein VPNG_03873 [Cytospora leucostoma]
MSFFQGNFISRPFESHDSIPDENRLTYNPPPNWRPASRDSSDGLSSCSGRSDGFDRSSSINDVDSSSRESSPGLEVIYNPDLSYRKEAAFQSREASGAPSAGQPDTDKPNSTPSFLPISDSFSRDDDEADEVDDELWDELMGISGNEEDEPQSSNEASAADPGYPQPDGNEEDDELLAMMTKSLEKELAETQNAEQPPAEEEEEDDMLAMMTASLEKELAETQTTEQLAASDEEAESARKKALLEEQLRVAAEKAALAAQFDDLHKPTERQSGATTAPRVAQRARLKDKMSGADQGLAFKGSPRALDRHARRMAAAEKARKAQLKPIAKAITETPARESSACTPSTASTPVQSNSAAPIQSLPAAPTQSMPAVSIQSMPAAPMASVPAAQIRSIPVPPRRYHLADILDWGLLTGRMTLTTNLNVRTCYKSLGLNPDRGQKLSNQLRAYLRTPGNSVNISREDITTERSKLIIAQLAHKLLCDERWGQEYFSRPHVERGYSGAKFETDSTYILLEFSKLLYKIVKAEERRKKAHLKSQEKKDEKNAAEHPVVSDFAYAPAGITTPRDLLHGAVPRPVPMQPVLTRPPAFAEPVSARPVQARPVVTQSVCARPVPVQTVPVQPVRVQSARVPPKPVQPVSASGREPVLDYESFMSAAIRSVPVQSARGPPPMPAQHVSAPGRGPVLDYKAFTSVPVQAARGQSNPAPQVSAPGHRPVMDYNAFMAIYGRKS